MRFAAFKPEDYGLNSYVGNLWDGEELIYYGRGSIRARLMDHFHGLDNPLTRRAKPSCSPSISACSASRRASVVRPKEHL